ncbi:unnamed protein product, partial [Heterotrigona itama]
RSSPDKPTNCRHPEPPPLLLPPPLPPSPSPSSAPPTATAKSPTLLLIPEIYAEERQRTKQMSRGGFMPISGGACNQITRKHFILMTTFLLHGTLHLYPVEIATCAAFGWHCGAVNRNCDCRAASSQPGPAGFRLRNARTIARYQKPCT